MCECFIRVCGLSRSFPGLHGREEIVSRLHEEASMEMKCYVHTKYSAFLSPASSFSGCCSHPHEEHTQDRSYLPADGQLRNAAHVASESLEGEFIACSPRGSEAKKG